MLTRRQRLHKLVRRTTHRLRPAGQPAVPVFLFGEMRSGTNMLLECFEHAPAAETFNETDPEAFVDYELRDPSELHRLVDRSRASHVVFKPTADTSRARELLDGFSPARGIWIYRRYQDAVNSALALWTQHREYLRLILEEPERTRWRAVGLSRADLELMRHHYARGADDASSRALIWYVRNRVYLRDCLDVRADALLVNYEDLVTRPGRILPGVFGFVGMPYRVAYGRHVVGTSIGRAPPPSIDAEIASLCDALMLQLDAARNRLSAADMQTKVAR